MLSRQKNIYYFTSYMHTYRQTLLTSTRTRRVELWGVQSLLSKFFVGAKTFGQGESMVLGCKFGVPKIWRECRFCPKI